MFEIKNIAVEKIHNHPYNPRKELGDLTELAESIKAKGVLQNLTIVPWFDVTTGAPADDPKQQEDMGYYAVIGNRRLAASKLAGLMEVPCVLSEMSQPEQARTMLMENMQRTDLTVYEQAQGFQMMIDLGDTVESVAHETGFSESTIRRRVKLLELDKDEFKKSEARGATLFDYMELDKIKDNERKNKVLESIGTNNFNFELKRAIDEEAAIERKERWITHLSSFATQVDSTDGYAYVQYYSSYTEPKAERPDDADTVEYFFCEEQYGGLRLLKKASADNTPKKSVAEVECKSQENEVRGLLKDITQRSYELREEFVNTVSTSCVKKHLAEIIAFDLWLQMQKYCDIDKDEIVSAFGIELCTAEGDGDEDEELTYDMVLASTAKAPEKVLWKIACCNMEDDSSEGYFDHWGLGHIENECLDNFYTLLVSMGYKMSDEEKSMQDGSHTLFQKAPEADDPGTEMTA